MIPASIRKAVADLDSIAKKEIERIKMLPVSKRRKAASDLRTKIGRAIDRIGKDAAMESCMQERRKAHPDEDVKQSVAVCLSKLGRGRKG